ncbi:MAG: DUF5906 domain-containing protein [Patescibacteria group bacterium]|nr:DUF5906 domain-containing protein [Patescibacteria group bacterium]
MFSLYFLSANKPLTKSFYLGKQGEIEKDSYPTVKNFTSHVVEVASLKDLYDATIKHSNLNHCMIKGKLKDSLENEPRANYTNSNDETFFLTIDLDGSPYKTPEEFVNAHKALKDVSYVVQYSSSYGIYESKKLSCHIFMMLSKPVQAPDIKPWLMSLNLANPVDRDAITLSRTGANLHYPIDITTCQNDKLIYIAPPIIKPGVKCTVKDAERIQYVKKAKSAVDSTIFEISTNDANKLNPEVIKKACRTILNDKRKAAGYEPLSKNTKMVGEYEVQPKPGEARLTGLRLGDEFTHMNLNGGDSWAYYHPNNNFELIHSFKHPDISFLTKEILPPYYKQCVANKRETNESPTEEGEMLLAFRDFKSDVYWNGTWNPVTYTLNIAKTRDVTRLEHFLLSKGRELGEYVPIWNMTFEPTKNYIVDEENHKINNYIPSPLMRMKHKPVKDWRAACPTIHRVMMSAVSDNKDDELYEHWLNWVAVVAQLKLKTKTAWLLTGVEGTGKGVIINDILRPMLGAKYVPIRKGTDLEEKYNGWMENALFGFIDEIHVPNSTRVEAIMSDLRNAITEPTISVRNMHMMSYEITNYINLIMSSNKPDPVRINEGDRRFNIGIFQSQKIKLNKHDVDVVIANELESFTHYIMTRPVDVDTANTVMHTDTRQHVIDTSRTSLDELGDQLKSGDLEKLWDSMPDLNLMAELHGSDSATASAYASIIKREIMYVHSNRNKARPNVGTKRKAAKDLVVAHSKLTRDELGVIFEHCVGNMPKTPHKFTALLRHRNIAIEPIKLETKTMRGIHTEWFISEQRLNEIVAELEIKPNLKLVGNIKKAKVA